MSPKALISAAAQTISNSTPMSLALVIGLCSAAVAGTWAFAHVDGKADAAIVETARNGAKIQAHDEILSDLTKQVTKLATIIDGMLRDAENRRGG